MLSACSGSPSSGAPDAGVTPELPDAGEPPDGGPPSPPADGGTGWTIRQSPRECLEQVEGVAFGHDTFVSVGGDGAVCLSRDASTWERKARLNAHLRAITFGQGIFVAVGTGGINNSSGAQLFTSPDGVTWTARQTALFGNELVDVVSNGSLFVAVGGHNGTHQGSIVSSPDGVTWTTRMDQQGRYLHCVLHAAGQFITGNFTSPDGISWTLHGDVSSFPAQVASGANLFVGVDSISIETSTDGLHWTPQPNSPVPLSDVAFDGTRFIAVGEKGTVLTSPDGQTWTPASLPSLENLSVIAVIGNLRMAAGASHFLSTNGVSWTEAEPTPRALSGVTKGGSLFVAVGANGTIETSLEGVTWTRRSSGTNEDLRQVRFLDGRFMAVGNAGSVLLSSDGEHWQVRSTGTGIRLSDVAWNGTQFAVTGEQGGATSPDGLTWTPVSYQVAWGPMGLAAGASRWVGIHPYGSPRVPAGLIHVASTFGDWQLLSGAMTPVPLRDVLFARGQFIAVARKSIYTSPDGVAWTLHSTGDVEWLSVSSDDSGFFLLGRDAQSLRPVVATSADGASLAIEDTGLTVSLSRAVSDGTRVVGVGTGGVIVTRP
jgi:hypothetical protein